MEWKGWAFLIVVCSAIGIFVGSFGPVIDSGESGSKVYRSTRKDMAGVAGEAKEWDMAGVKKALSGFGLEVVEVRASEWTVVLVCERRRGSKVKPPNSRIVGHPRFKE